MRLELIPLPVTDVDAALAFYRDQAGFRLDHDVSPGDGVRVVQLTPPGSSCSISFGTGMTPPDAPRVRGMHLVVDDIAAIRADLVARGVAVTEPVDVGGVHYAQFADPDGNTYALQQIDR